MTEDKALCRRNRTKGKPSLWDDRLPNEKTEDLLKRNHQARLLCNQCQLLDQCETYLTEFEKEGLPIAGVIAGRYSDVRTHHNSDNTTTQTTCKTCEIKLIPQARKNKKPHKNIALHAGEGLCTQCFPKYSRTARKTA